MRFFLEHSTLIFTLLYGYVTVVGMSNSFFLYRAFGINVFDYAEIGDFLLAAFRNPVAIVSGAYLLIGVIVITQMRTDLLSAEEKARTNNRSGALYGRWALYGVAIAFFIINPIFNIYFAGIGTAAIIKRGEESKVEVRYRSYSGSAEQVTEQGLELIGATQKVVFFYDVNDKDNKKDNHTLVVPQTQIISIEVPDKRSDRTLWFHTPSQ